MQTHMDSDFPPSPISDAFLDKLEEQAKAMTKAKENLLTAGAPGETALAEWQHFNMAVKQLPDDPLGVLRVSVGGTPDFGYCVFRGPQGGCLELLKQAVAALEKARETT